MANEPQKPPGWFSRRHETSAAHQEAQEHYRNRAEGRPKQVWNDETKQWEKS